jgi:hypothetical protein
MYTREDLSDGYQMAPRLSPTLSYTNGLNCLKLTDSLYVKQHASLKEGKLFETKNNLYANLCCLLKLYLVLHLKRNLIFLMTEMNGYFMQSKVNRYHFNIEIKMSISIFEKLRHFGNVSVVQLDDVLHFVFLTIIIR